MPSTETSRIRQRSRLIDAHLAGGLAMTAFCARYQISHRTGYKWNARYVADVSEGLADRHRPLPRSTKTNSRRIPGIRRPFAHHMLQSASTHATAVVIRSRDRP